jgi:murein DD-endopeptidase MepM/ murein hydrolase activator NlpD
MEKGYSVVITSTESGKTRNVFFSRRDVRLLTLLVCIVVVVVVGVIISYSRVYYSALQVEMLKRRNREIEQEFAKLEEIKENLEITERDRRKVQIMLGIEKAPPPVEPEMEKTTSEYTNTIAVEPYKDENVPSLVPTRGQISRNYSPEHEGIDIAAPLFAPVVAAASGAVSAAGWDSIFGNYVIVEHDANYTTFYGHLQTIEVKHGSHVSSGEVIGTVGSTGKSTSPHLHYEVRFRGRAVDPVGYVQFIGNF